MASLCALLVLALPAAQDSAVVRYPNAELEIQGQALRFGLEIHPGPPARAFLLNASERIEVPRVEFVPERRLVLGFDHYASEIRAQWQPDAGPYGDGGFTGTWRKRRGRGQETVVPFRAPGGPASECGTPFLTGTAPDLLGDWKVSFSGAGGADSEPGVARFRALAGDWPDFEATMLTPTGDYRFLAGRWYLGYDRFLLSCFDGAHAFLFEARFQPDGSLAGDFWSRDSWHERWRAEKLPPGTDVRALLPDPLSMTRVRPGERFGFRFPDLDGRPVSLDDPRFRGKALIVEIFGSWCPNCQDAAPVLADLRRRYGPSGLEVIGLAYELTGDPALDAVQVRRYAERHGADWPILLAGTAPKAGASRTLPALTGVKSYPTTLFLHRDGSVAEIYTGFSGPATGEEYARLKARWDRTVRGLVAEPHPQR